MKLPDFLKQLQFLTNGMTEPQMEKIKIAFEHWDEHGQFIKARQIRHVEYDERFNQIIFTEDDETNDEDKDAIRLTDDYSRD